MKNKNIQLEEISNIKDEYIGRSFYANAEYINKVEKLYRSIDRKIAFRRYEDIHSLLKQVQCRASSTFVKNPENPKVKEAYNALVQLKNAETKTIIDSL